ncbi:MAG: M20/M25/M40 family metallo-hydrolase [Fuerstiella sp.]
MRTFSVTLLAGICGLAAASENSTGVTERVSEDIEFLASDALEGRGVQTKGIEVAAERILNVYKAAGLKPAVGDSYRQEFPISVGKTVAGDSTLVKLSGPEDAVMALKLAEQFQPLQVGGAGAAHSELVFVGYGISSQEDGYDDYQGVDVEGKVVVMIRREPRQKIEGSKFNGRRTSQHAYINSKLALAKKNKVGAILFVNDPSSTKNSKDELSEPNGFGSRSQGVPFFHVSQDAINQLLAKSPLTVDADGTERQLGSLEAVEAEIDRNLKPVSQTMAGWNAEVEISFETESVNAYNLLGILEGEGPLAKEFVVVGAHYDHIGLGGVGSRAAARRGEVHNGADDNASGTAAVMELARRLAEGPAPKRSIIFACFSGEERGLLGSSYYVTDPVVPLADTAAMLNFDMIGTLRNNKVDVGGVGTGNGLRAIVSAADETSELQVKTTEHAFAGSDHLPFIRNKVPAMFCFTGMTDRYHTPDDDFAMINVEGAVKVIDLAEDILRGMAAMPVRPTFQSVNGRTKKVPYLGAIPVLSAEEGVHGVRVRIVRKDSPAEAAGLQVGDVIVNAGGKDIEDYSSLIAVLRGKAEQSEISLTVMRGETEVKVTAKLASSK